MLNQGYFEQLNERLLNNPIDKVWYSLLVSHIGKSSDDFRYILQDRRLKKATIYDVDLLAGLTVGEASILYEYSLAHSNRKDRKEQGQYFTPDDVAQFMARKANAMNASNKAVWLDPCSGVGNLSYWLVDQQEQRESFLKHNMLLADRDPLALFIARVLFTLRFQDKDKNLFNTIEDRFIELDFLEVERLPEFDYAILNPPYVVTGKNDKFLSAKTRNTYAYFLERVMQRAQGFISITPQNFTHGSQFGSIRNLLIEQYNQLRVYCFDNVPDNIFKGIKYGSENSNTVNSTRAGIIVAWSDGEKSKNHQITPLLRWRSHERTAMLSGADEYLAKAPLSNQIFPKVQKELVGLYRDLTQVSVRLSSVVSKIETPFILQIPSTPRYFIPALKTPVSRTSSRTLYFNNERDLNRAYLLLNSSVLYWWWRVNDGGMTLSEKTLMSMPWMVDFAIDNILIKKLEDSEITSKVVKLNAGKHIENVKHDQALLDKLNQVIFPEYAEVLLATHRNSHIMMDKIVSPSRNTTMQGVLSWKMQYGC